MDLSAKDAFYIGGTWVPVGDREALAVVDPATEEQISSVPAGTAEDVDAAVAAARKAFAGWAATPAADRAALLERRGRRPRGAHRRGGPAHLHRDGHAAVVQQGGAGRQPGPGAALLRADPGRLLLRGADRATPSWSRSRSASSARSRRGTTRCTRSWPRSPRRWPPAAPSCSSPREVAPLSAFALAEVFEQVGLPAGVFNLVTGLGSGRRRGHRRPPRRRHGLVHRLHRCRQARAGRRRRDREEGRAGARRQERVRRPRRRRPRQGRQDRPGQLLHQRRPDLHRLDPHARAGRQVRRGARPHQGRRRQVPGGRADRRGHPHRPAGQRQPVQEGARLHRAGRRGRRDRRRRRCGAPRGLRHRLLRPADRARPTSPRARASSRRRSSDRCSR